MGPLGWQETMFIFVLALLVFGPKKLPELGRTIGKAMTEFRRASNELKSTFENEMREIERETESIKEVATSYHNEIQASTSDYNQNYDYNYDSSYYDSGAYGSETDESTASNPSTVSASASQGAENEASAASTGETVTTEVAANTEPAGDQPAGHPVEPVKQDTPASETRA
jgi:TatA/E family protein of Tat protein translocase